MPVPLTWMALFCSVLATTASPAPLRVTARPAILQPGSVAVLTIDTGEPVADVRARAFDRDLRPFAVTDRTWEVLVGIDLDVRPGTYPVAIDTGPSTSPIVSSLTVSPRRFATRALRVDPNLVNPPPQELDRIAREAERLHRIWDAPPGARLWTGPFVRPVPDAANSSFGTRSTYNGQPRSPHAGTDFLSPSGRPVTAPNAGRVVLAGSLYFTGGTIVIDHGLGVFTLFAHLSAIDVHEGDMVHAGDLVGAVGATGRVTGPHLHWTARVSGARVDPLLLLAAMGKTGPPD